MEKWKPNSRYELYKKFLEVSQYRTQWKMLIDFIKKNFTYDEIFAEDLEYDLKMWNSGKKETEYHVETELKILGEEFSSEAIFDHLCDYLKEFDINGIQINKEDHLQYFLYGLLHGYFDLEKYQKQSMEIEFELERDLKDCEVHWKPTLKNKTFIDLMIETDVGIEIKYNPDKNELHRFIGQLWDYANQMPFVIGFVVFSNRLIGMGNFLDSKPKNCEIIVKFLDNSNQYKDLTKIGTKEKVI